MEVNLLIIDDEPIHIKQVEHIIKSSGVEASCRSFLDASDALTFILNDDNIDLLPDLILLDLNMPVISGWSFLELFETINPCLPKPIDIIILSACISLDDTGKLSAYKSVKGIVKKPITETMLLDILNSPFVFFNKYSKYLCTPEYPE